MPQTKPGEVLVRVKACGLGLTLVWNRNDRVAGRSGKLPRIIGHEIAGDVVELGEGVGGFQPGDRVNVYFYLTMVLIKDVKKFGREHTCGIANPEGNGAVAIESVREPEFAVRAETVCER